MDLQHINVKLFVDGDLPFEPGALIDVFHRWIEQQVVGELLIDVADYRHVPAGPGVMLIAHEADYNLDNSSDRWGLRYNCKAEVDGSNADRIAQAFSSAAKAAELLEAEFGSDPKLQFSRREFELLINDRALAPNTPETFASLKADVQAFVGDRLGQSDAEIKPISDDPRTRVGVIVTTNKPIDFAASG